MIPVIIQETVAKFWPQAWIDVPLTAEFKAILNEELKKHLPSKN